jgi:hypothetical protein
MPSQKISVKTWWAVLAVVCFCASIPMAFAQTQTAQSIMVDLTYDNGTTYQIEGTITWTFDRGTSASPDCAMNAYTHAWDGNSPAITTGSGADPGAVTAPAPDGGKLQNHAQAERCTFFCGGTLTSTSYTQTVNQARGWKRTFTYNITPISASVAADTCWTSEETGGTVDVGFTGFVCSESFQKQTSRSKYSFTLASRVSNVEVALQKLDGSTWSTIQGPVFVPEADPTTGLLPVTPATEDFHYFANSGFFGNSAVFGALHYANGKSENSVGKILNGISDGTTYVDNFAGNNNDLAAGNVHVAHYTGEWEGLTEAGTYRTRVTGTLKGNAGQADVGFVVTSDVLVIGGCTCSQ